MNNLKWIMTKIYRDDKDAFLYYKKVIAINSILYDPFIF